MNSNKDDAWQEAKRRCRLNEKDVRMAKELGLQPKSLIKNIPGASEQWKAPVNEWVRSIYQKKIGSRKPKAASSVVPRDPGPRPDPAPPSGASVIEFRNPDHPWPDRPAIPAIRPYVPPEFEDEEEDDEDGQRPC